MTLIFTLSVIWTLSDRPHQIHMLAIKTQNRLESVIPLAIVHVTAHAAQNQLDEKEIQKRVREICGTRSVEVVVELAPGPPHQSEVG